MSNKFRPKNRKVGTKTTVNSSIKVKNSFEVAAPKEKSKAVNSKILVEASPPIGDVPDPNNPGNVIICHFTDPGYISLSIPAASVTLHSTHTNDYDGACTTPGDDLPVYCPPGSAPDCNGVCNGPSVLDCEENCYNPITTPAAFLRDCAGVCYDVLIGPPNVPDCNGVCGGTSYPDCNGVCDGTDTIDCAGVCGGNATIDCGGNCTECQTVVEAKRRIAAEKDKFLKTRGPQRERQPDHLLDKFRTDEFKSTNKNSPKAIQSVNVPEMKPLTPQERTNVLMRPRAKKSNSHRTHRTIATGPQYTQTNGVNLTNDRIKIRMR